MARGPKSSTLEKMRAVGDDAPVIEVKREIKRGGERICYLKKWRPSADAEQGEVVREKERLENLLKRKATSQHDEASSSLRQKLATVLDNAMSALSDVASQEQAVSLLAATLAAFGRKVVGRTPEEKPQETSS